MPAGEIARHALPGQGAREQSAGVTLAGRVPTTTEGGGGVPPSVWGGRGRCLVFDVLQIFVMDPPRRPGAAGGTAKPWPGGSRGLPGPRPPQHMKWLPAAAAPAGAAAAAGGHSVAPAGPTTPPIGARCVPATCVRHAYTVSCEVFCVVKRGERAGGREGPGACLRHACDLPTKCPA